MMTRILTLSCILLAIATFAVISAEPSVKIQTSAPQLVNPGDEFMVRFSIDKAALQKGAVLQQIIPEGFTASAIENEGAEFIFENQMVRFVWDKLPTKSIIVIAFKLKAEENVRGIKRLKGTFIYAKNNNTDQINLPESIIYVTNEFPVSNARDENETLGNLSIRRDIEERKGELSNGYRITMQVNNEGETGSASWIDQIPAGYTIEVNAAYNSNFSRDGRLVKFHWSELPPVASWTFSYTIYPPENTTAEFQPELLGIMVYGQTGALKTCLPNAGSQSRQPSTPLAYQVAPELIHEEFRKTATPGEPSNESIDEVVSENSSDTSTEFPGNSEAAGKNENSTLASSSEEISPMVQKGIYYRVQIAATKRSPSRDSEFFRSKFQITRPVDMVEQDGWKKYCIGVFARQEPAKKVALETRATISDAFVVAYRDGVRIPVPEAMEMLSISQ